MITFDQYYNKLTLSLDKYIIKDLSNILLNYLFLKDINLKLINLENNISNKNINTDIFKFTNHNNIYTHDNITVKDLIYFEYNNFYIFISNKNIIYVYIILKYHRNYLHFNYNTYKDVLKSYQFNSEIDFLFWIHKNFERVKKFTNIIKMLEN